MSNTIKFNFLGDSGSCPTKDRNLSSLVFTYDGKNYLLDCPENVQQHLMKQKISISKIKAIFITHFHGDHYYGLFGLLATMKINHKEDELFIFVPQGYKKKLLDVLVITNQERTFKLSIIEVNTTFKYAFNNLQVSVVKLNHSISSFGYIFKIKDKLGKFNKKKALALGVPEGPLFSKLQENKTVIINKKKIHPNDVIDKKYKKIGFKFAYLLDTAPLKKIPSSLNNLNLLISEATFLEEHKDNAKKFMHLTAKEAAELAKKIKPKKLFLTHISTRYKDTKDHEKEAKKYFKNTELAGKSHTFDVFT